MVQTKLYRTRHPSWKNDKAKTCYRSRPRVVWIERKALLNGTTETLSHATSMLVETACACPLTLKEPRETTWTGERMRLLTVSLSLQIVTSQHSNPSSRQWKERPANVDVDIVPLLHRKGSSCRLLHLPHPWIDNACR